MAATVNIAGFVLLLLKIYMDNINITTTGLPPSSRLINNKIEIVEAEIKNDRKIPINISTSKILKTDYSFRKYTFYEYNASYFKSEIQNWDGIYKKETARTFDC